MNNRIVNAIDVSTTRGDAGDAGDAKRGVATSKERDNASTNNAQTYSTILKVKHFVLLNDEPAAFPVFHDVTWAAPNGEMSGDAGDRADALRSGVRALKTNVQANFGNVSNYNYLVYAKDRTCRARK